MEVSQAAPPVAPLVSVTPTPSVAPTPAVAPSPSRTLPPSVDPSLVASSPSRSQPPSGTPSPSRNPARARSSASSTAPSPSSVAPTPSEAPKLYVAPSASRAGARPAAPPPATSSPKIRSRQFVNQNNQTQPPKPGNDCKVHVNGFPPYTQPQDLSMVFSAYGKVTVDRLNSRFAFLTFATPAEATAAIRASRSVNIYGEFLTVKPYDGKQHGLEMRHQQTPKRDFTRSKQKCMIVEPKDIDLSTGSFYDQMDRVLVTVRLTKEEATAIGMLYHDLETVLQVQWPGCVAMPFGSITTGMGIKTSDADCFVHIPSKYPNARATAVIKAKKLLQTYPLIFAEILSIPRANTPIVKFFHIPTEINCDLSFKTPLGAQNSKLISFLLHSDPRLIPTAVLIKYWAKVHGLSGTGKLTNYALVMMLIFYFQQPPMSILPSVEWLQRDPANDVIVDYWNTGFMDNPIILPRSSNTSSICELFGGFFEYYASFNFAELVVCPYTGTAINKESFNGVNQLPNTYERYRQNVINGRVMPMRFTTPMCVQDPFEQSHNVASAITSKFSDDLKAFFKFAADAYEKEKLNECKEFLKIILHQKPILPKPKHNTEYKVRIFPRILCNITDSNWKPIVREIIKTIFEKILKFELEKVEFPANIETKRERDKYTTALLKPVWKRKPFARLYTMVNLEFQRKQEKITEEIFSVGNHTFDVHFQLTVTFASTTRNVAITIKQTEGEVEPFREFGKFFISVTQNWFMTLMRPYVKGLTAAQVAAAMRDSIKGDNGVDSEDSDNCSIDSTTDPTGESDDVATAANDNDVNEEGGSVVNESL